MRKIEILSIIFCWDADINYVENVMFETPQVLAESQTVGSITAAGNTALIYFGTCKTVCLALTQFKDIRQNEFSSSYSEQLMTDYADIFEIPHER